MLGTEKRRRAADIYVAESATAVSDLALAELQVASSSRGRHGGELNAEYSEYHGTKWWLTSGGASLSRAAPHRAPHLGPDLYSQANLR
jgi:hypothetical protein